MAGNNEISISLSPIGYQFPDMKVGDWHDLNWLRIAGKVEAPDGSWSFNDPCMLTTEAARLGEWLREAADGKVQPTAPNATGEIYPSCDFTEPNVAFGVEVREAGDVILRVHFSLESAPPWSGDEQRVVSHQVFVRCWLSEESLRRSADE